MMTDAQFMQAIATGSKPLKAGIGVLTNNLQVVIKAWQKLTMAQQTAWNNAAPDFPFKNKFGESYTASGYQVFCSLNSNMQLIGAALHVFPPDPHFPDLSGVILTSLNDPMDPYKLQFTSGDSDNVAVKVFANPQTIVSRSFRKGKEKLLGIADLSKTLIWDATYNTNYLFGIRKPAGVTYFRLVPISKISGLAGQEIIFPINTNNIIPSPKLMFWINSISLPSVPDGGSKIWPFRLFSAWLTGDTSITLEGTNADRFKLSIDPAGPFTDSLNLSVDQFKQAAENILFFKFLPNDLGNFYATIRVSSPGASDKVLPITAVVVDPAMTGSPDPLAFGNVYNNIGKILPYTINAVGVNDLQYVSMFGADAADFKVSLSPTGPWQSMIDFSPTIYDNIVNKVVYIKMGPGGLGAKTANVKLDNGGLASVLTDLTGTLINGLSTTVPTSLAFGDVPNGEELVLPLLINAEGLGQALNVAIAGADPDQFSISLDPDGSFVSSLDFPPDISGKVIDQTIYVKFAPNSAAAFTGNVSLTSYQFTTNEVALTGTGT